MPGLIVMMYAFAVDAVAVALALVVLRMVLLPRRQVYYLEHLQLQVQIYFRAWDQTEHDRQYSSPLQNSHKFFGILLFCDKYK